MGSLVSRFKLDIIANLPPELVLQVISYLSVQEVLQCTLVCKRWNHIISHLAPYWTITALKTAGLSKNTISKSLSQFSSPKKFYFAALSHKEAVRGLNLTPSHVRHPIPEQLLFTHCLDAREKCIVRTQIMAEDGESTRQELVVEELVGIPEVPEGVFSEQIASLPLQRQLKVIWAHVNGGLLYWVTSTGLWKCYDLVSKEIVFAWKNPLVKEGKEVVVTKCKYCSMVALSSWSPASINDQDHQSTHTVQLIWLGDNKSSPTQLVQCKKIERKHSHKYYTEQDSRYWIQSSFLLPNCQHNDSDKSCSSHTLILQCDSSIMIHSLHMPTITDTEKSIPDPDIHFSKPTCLNCDYELSSSTTEDYTNRAINSEVKVSSDNSLIGQVFNMKLYVWENKCTMRKDDKNIRLMSSAPLVRKHTGTCNSVKLVAVGQILSIVAFMDNGYLLDYKLQLVQTNTGQVLTEFRRIERFYNWSLCCQIDPVHKFYFMHQDEDWLNDVQAKVPPTPITTVHNHHGKVHMEALQLRHKVNQTWRDHWRYAVNYGLRE